MFFNSCKILRNSSAIPMRSFGRRFYALANKGLEPSIKVVSSKNAQLPQYCKNTHFLIDEANKEFVVFDPSLCPSLSVKIKDQEDKEGNEAICFLFTKTPSQFIKEELLALFPSIPMLFPIIEEKELKSQCPRFITPHVVTENSSSGLNFMEDEAEEIMSPRAAYLWTYPGQDSILFCFDQADENKLPSCNHKKAYLHLEHI